MKYLLLLTLITFSYSQKYSRDHDDRCKYCDHYDGLSISNIDLDDGNLYIERRGRTIVEIREGGELYVRGKKVDVTRQQRRMLDRYVFHLEYIIEESIEIGLEGAEIGLTAAAEAVSAVFTFDTDSYFWDENNGIVTGGYVENYVDGMPSGEAYSKSEMRIIRTRDGGDTWENAYESNRPAEWGWKFHFVNSSLGFTSIQSFRGQGPGYPAYTEEHILKTADGGESWQEIVITTEEDQFYSTQGILFLNENVGWIGSWRRNLPMRYTFDGGKTWRDSDYIGTVNRFRKVSDNVIYAVSHDILKIDLRETN
jgi:hypothetical protein